MKLDVFGCKVLAERTNGGWRIYYLGEEGKRRLADDLMVPSFITESEIRRYLADLCHEWASTKHPDVRRID